MKQILHSSAFYTDPSALKGSARLADLFGGLDSYNQEDSERENDTKALQRDWQMVGMDLKVAAKEYGQTTKQTTKK